MKANDHWESLQLSLHKHIICRGEQDVKFTLFFFFSFLQDVLAEGKRHAERIVTDVSGLVDTLGDILIAASTVISVDRLQIIASAQSLGNTITETVSLPPSMILDLMISRMLYTLGTPWNTFDETCYVSWNAKIKWVHLRVYREFLHLTSCCL